MASNYIQVLLLHFRLSSSPNPFPPPTKHLPYLFSLFPKLRLHLSIKALHPVLSKLIGHFKPLPPLTIFINPFHCHETLPSD